MAKVDLNACDVTKAQTGALVAADGKDKVAIHNPFTGKTTTATLDTCADGRAQLAAAYVKAERAVEAALRPLADIIEGRNGKRADLAAPAELKEGAPATRRPSRAKRPTTTDGAAPDTGDDGGDVTGTDNAGDAVYTPGGSPAGTYEGTGSTGGYGYD